MQTDDFIAALPKVELHVHLEGSLLPETLLALARKHELTDLLAHADDFASWYAFRDFPHFVEVYLQAVQALREEEDFALMTRDVAANLARQNVRYAEIHVSLYNHLERDIPAEVVFAGLEAARKEAERDHGIVLRWIPDFAGHVGPHAGDQSLDAVLAHGPASVIAFGVGGIEVEREPFADVFARARAAGLHSVVHAGETEGPDRVWAAIRDLHAERIGHGIGAVRDPQLVDELVDRRIPVDVCPTSNLRTRMVERLADHPLPRMIDAGLLVTLNSDDPPMFDTDLTQEYIAAQELGVDIAMLARNGVEASFLGVARKTELLKEIDAVESRFASSGRRRSASQG